MTASAALSTRLFWLPFTPALSQNGLFLSGLSWLTVFFIVLPWLLFERYDLRSLLRVIFDWREEPIVASLLSEWPVV